MKRGEKLKAASLRGREESMRVSAEFAAIQYDPEAIPSPKGVCLLWILNLFQDP